MCDILADISLPAEMEKSQLGKSVFSHYKIFHSLGKYVFVLSLQFSSYLQQFVFSRYPAIAFSVFHDLGLVIGQQKFTTKSISMPICTFACHSQPDHSC